MEFKKFENKTDFLEYIQIFAFYELLLQKKTDFKIENYIQFELTDNIISEYNKWVLNSNKSENIVKDWFVQNQVKVEYFKQNFPEKFQPKVAIWNDRNKTNYFKQKLQESFIFENYIAELILKNYGLEIAQYLTPYGQYELGENALGIEIKFDTLIKKYGNLYIEYMEKSKNSNSNFVNSGILKKDNCKYFLIGTQEKFYIFRKQRLIDILYEEVEILKNKQKSFRNIKFKQISTSKGFVFPVKNAIKETISIDLMIEEIKSEKF